MDVIIVVHTELGYVHSKKVIYDRNAEEGVVKGVLNLVTLAERYGAKITFAVTPEAADAVPKDIDHEIGLHIEPGWEEVRMDGSLFLVGDKYLRDHCHLSSTSTVLPGYPYHEQLDMIRTGIDCISDTLGVRPTTFVAGRWSIDNSTIRALIHAGITRDCSATPHSKQSHYDWSRLARMCMPYHPSERDYQAQGTLPLLEVPISRMWLGGNVNPEEIPLVGVSWLKACFSEYYLQNLPFFHICLHSPCMTDPYYLSAMDELLGFIAGHRSLSFKFASEIQEYAAVHPTTHIMPYLQGLNRKIIGSAGKALLKRMM